MLGPNPVHHFKKADKPLILAHRGMVTEHQENTISAVKAAIASDKAHGCEFDVMLTRDNQVVVFHDPNLKRLTGDERDICDVTWAELKKLVIPKRVEINGVYKEYPSEERIPLLAEVLEELKGKACFVDLELKSSFPRWSTRKLGTEAAKVVRQLGVEDQLVSSSIDFFMLYSMEKEHGGIHTGFAYDDDMPLSARFLNWAMERNLVGKWIHSTISAVEHTLLDHNSTAKLHKRGLGVGTYTLFPLGQETELAEQHSQEARRMAEIGVDWIETDNPAMVYDLIY